MEKNNLFDLNDLEDIPEHYRSNIKFTGIQKKGFSQETLKILSIFDLKESLDVNEILVALYRKYKIKKGRQNLQSTLHHLEKKNLISRNDGLYKKSEIGE